jgi:hypothetical protein
MKKLSDGPVVEKELAGVEKPEADGCAGAAELAKDAGVGFKLGEVALAMGGEELGLFCGGGQDCVAGFVVDDPPDWLGFGG